MNFGTQDTPETEVPRQLKPGQVFIQWRCRGNHPNCEGQKWKNHSAVSEVDAKAIVDNANDHQHMFDYRVNP